MLNFFYVNNILINSKAARGRQVFENEKAFRKLLQQELLSWSADSFLLTRIFANENNRLRKLFFHLFLFIRLLFLSKKVKVYSRNLSVVYLAKRLGFASFWEAHDLPTQRNDQLLRKIKNGIRIVAISQALANKLIAVYEFPDKDIVVAHDGVDIEAYDAYRMVSREQLREKYSLPLRQKILLHSGSIMSERGTDLFQKVLQALPNWFFVQVGGRESDMNRLQDELKGYSNFKMIPHQDAQNLIQLQLSADALFYMITEETSTFWCCSPMKIFEYLACGKPIIGSNIGSLVEILNTDVAFVFDPADHVSLQTALSLLGNEALCDAVSRAALTHVRENFTWNLRAKNILQFAGVLV